MLSMIFWSHHTFYYPIWLVTEDNFVYLLVMACLSRKNVTLKQFNCRKSLFKMLHKCWFFDDMSSSWRCHQPKLWFLACLLPLLSALFCHLLKCKAAFKQIPSLEKSPLAIKHWLVRIRGVKWINKYPLAILVLTSTFCPRKCPKKIRFANSTQLF